MTKSGQNAINSRIIIATIKYGNTPLNDSSIDIFDIAPAISRHSPYGGVTSPRARVITTTRPNSTGSVPTASAAGKIIGTNNIIAGIASINVPTNKKNKTTIAINDVAPPGIFIKNSAALVDTL